MRLLMIIYLTLCGGVNSFLLYLTNKALGNDTVNNEDKLTLMENHSALRIAQQSIEEDLCRLKEKR